MIRLVIPRLQAFLPPRLLENTLSSIAEGINCFVESRLFWNYALITAIER